MGKGSHQVSLYVLVFLPFVIAIAMICLCSKCCPGTGQASEWHDTVRVMEYDTIAFHQPAPKDSAAVSYITEKLPVASDKEDNFLNKSQFGDSTEMVGCDSLKDSVDVVIPITQTVYEDSTYTAYVSGYRASLDSLIFRMPREVVTIKEYSKPKRWSVGIQVGYGMTLKGTPQFAPYIGIGVSYNLFSF